MKQLHSNQSTTCRINSNDRLYPNPPPAANSKGTNKVWIGGPGTKLPFWVESCLAWMLAISCLGVALYHWIQQRFGSVVFLLFPSSELLPVVPLMTHSRSERTNASGLQRYQQLMQYLSTSVGKKPIEEWTNTDWIRSIRNDTTVRRLVSLIRLQQKDIPPNLQPFIRRLESIWDQLLPMPSLPNSPTTTSIQISLITSAYKEDGHELLSKFQQVVATASRPKDVELIVVDAGHCHQLDLVSTLQFGKVTIVSGPGGGRGPSLNHGAGLAQGSILSFLHADTRLSKGWDSAIRNTLLVDANITACAFSFAIDTTPQGLMGGPFPPGIKAIETTANWRTQLFHLPYGDQCISIPKLYFDYLGGYPHQCLMEDYELVRLLRHRSSAGATSSALSRERLAILPLFAYCGPRRWQALGVLYVTYTNSRCVNLYANERITPDDLFEIYYGVPANPLGTTVLRKSPWEIQLEQQVSR